MQNHIFDFIQILYFSKGMFWKQNIGYIYLQQTEYISDEQYESINTD